MPTRPGSRRPLVRPWYQRLSLWLSAGETWTYHHATVFTITFASFACVHASRKTLATVKTSLTEAWTNNGTGKAIFVSTHDAQQFLGLLDSAFLVAYALGLYVGGWLGDVHEPRRVLSIGMALSSTCVFLFGPVAEWLDIRSPTYYLVTWTLCGLFQSVTWPAEVSVVGNWFVRARGAVLGVWSACGSVGNIIGTMIAAKSVPLGYHVPFLLNAILLYAAAYMVHHGLVNRPSEIGLTDTNESWEDGRLMEVRETAPQSGPAISYSKACCLPGVPSYSLAYACLKLVNYGFFFWLPFYLHSAFGWSESDADALSAWYDVGGIVAAIAAGLLSDHMATRTPVIVAMLWLSTVALYFYSYAPSSYMLNGILLFVVGFFVGGPANMISSAVSADLGKSREVGESEALATVTAIVDGTGSLGASFGQLAIPALQRMAGWSSVFVAFIIMEACTALCLTPLLLREVCQRRRPVYRTVSSDFDDAIGPLMAVTRDDDDAESLSARRRP